MKYCPLCKSSLVIKEIDNKNVLSCSSDSCEYVFWNNPIPVVIGVVSYNGKYIITNNADWPDWKYSLISGFVDTQESPEEAMTREVFEELSLKATNIKLLAVNSYEKLNQILISYFVEAHGEIHLNAENRTYKLLTFDELRQWQFGKGATTVLESWFKNTGGFLE